jgi:ankyrin repeat protein
MPLHRAAQEGHVDAVQYLVEKGANIEATSVRERGCIALRVLASCLTACAQDGWTPLHWAAVYGHVDAVRYLVDKGANINATNKVRERGCICVACTCLLPDWLVRRVDTRRSILQL